MALLGTLILVFVLLIRPQEFIPELQPLSLLNVATALAGLGILFELVTGRQKPVPSPQLPWLGMFLLWSIAVTILRLGVTDGFRSAWESVGLATIFMLVIQYAGRAYERYRGLAVMLIAVGLAISTVCIHQARQEAQCIVLDTSASEEEKSEGTPDGRACESAYLCEKDGKPHASYMCEKVGLFGTFTAGMRVRWRGTLGDPNELAVMVGAMIPFLFAFNTVIRKKSFSLLMFAMLGVALWCVVLTGSRGGQLVILSVLGVYFVRRYGAKGFIAGGVLALPVLLLGGRGGEEAESSSLERIQLLYEGMDMIKAAPFAGVGVGQFQEHTFNALTAHNSYVLAAAELGIPGAILWCTLVYVSIKIPYVIATRPPPGLDPRVPPFAFALVVSFTGFLVGIFFLSFCYKQLLFIYLGLAGALYGLAKRAQPDLKIGVSVKEVAYVTGVEMALLVFVFVYSRLKGTG